MKNIYSAVFLNHIKPPKRIISIDVIFDAVADYYLISTGDIMRHNRKYAIAEARQIAWMLTRKHTSLSLDAIGEYVIDGKPFDHTTVLHGLKAIQNRIDTEPIIKDRYEQILQAIKSRKAA